MIDERSPPADLPFATLGHYEIVSWIGQGAMGDVYLGYEGALDRRVALKVLPLELGRNAEFMRRFRAEATAAAGLVHPNIIPIYYIGEDQSRLFFAMQYVEGESLESLLARENRLTAEQAMPIVKQVLSALEAAHRQGLIHRDVKPGNILLDRVTGQALVADFGLVKALGSGPQGQTATGMIIGTADYMAPEQARGKPVDARSDLYALGVVMYRMLSGRLPFTAESPLALSFKHVYEPAPALPETLGSLAVVVARLLEKAPDDRYQSAESVLDDLRLLPLASAPCMLPMGILEDGVSAGASVRRSPSVVRAPAADRLVGEALDMRPVPRWERVRDLALSVFRRHAPEVLQQLQNTQQQADGAVAEYTRRQRDLLRLADEARRNAADLRAELASHSSTETADDLRRNLFEQEQELAAIQARLARVEAVLETVRSQRDLLLARLKIAELRSGAAATVKRRRLQRLAFAVGGAAATLAALSVILRTRSEMATTHSASGALSTANTERAVPEPQVRKLEPPLRTHVREHPQFGAAPVQSRIVSLAIREGNRLVTVACDDGAAGIWDSPAAQAVPLQTATSARPQSIVCSPDGRSVVAVVAESPSGPCRLQLWNSSEGGGATEIATLTASAKILSVSGSQATVALRSGDSIGEIVNWDLQTGRVVSRKRLESTDQRLTAINADGLLWAAADESGEIVICRLSESDPAELLDRFACGAEPTAIGFHPVTSALAVGTVDGRVFLRDGRRAETQFEIKNQGDRIRALAFDVRGRRLAVASGDQVRVWDLGLDYVRFVLAVPGASALAFNADGTELATAGEDGVARIWNTSLEPVVDFYPWLTQVAATQEPEAAILAWLPQALKVDPMRVVSRDGRLAVVKRIDETAYVEDARTGQWLYALTSPRVMAATISPDGRYAATSHASADRGKQPGINVWNVRSGRVVQRFGPTSTAPAPLVFSADSAVILFAESGVLNAWNVESGEKLHELRISRRTFQHFLLSADLRQIVVSYTIENVAPTHSALRLLYDLEIGVPVLEFRGCEAGLVFGARNILCDRRYGTLERMPQPMSAALAQ